MDIQALMLITADAKQTQDLVTLVPWTFIIQICNLFIQVYLIMLGDILTSAVFDCHVGDVIEGV